MTGQKYVALTDCDCFFVSCERVLNPELNNLPVCVVSGEKGCVISRSREAKMLGIPMGIPLFQAVEKFPTCVFLNANHYNYTILSQRVMKILKNYAPNVEVYSIDEAFVDFTGLTKLYKKNYFQLAKQIQQEILDKVGIPVTIGISKSKTLAKLASDKAKNTSTRISLVGKCKINELLKYTDIQEVWGIGRQLSKRLKGLGVYTALDYIQKDEDWIKTRFGKNGLTTHAELMGILVSKVSNERELPKSISDTKSFLEFSSDFVFLKNELAVHIHSVCSRLRKIDCKASTAGIILKTKNFITLYEKIKLDNPTNFEFDISKACLPLLEKMYSPNVLYRSIGIVLEDFNELSNEQLSLFTDTKKTQKSENLGRSLDKLEEKFGRNIVKVGFTNKEIPFKQGFLTKPVEIDEK